MNSFAYGSEEAASNGRVVNERQVRRFVQQRTSGILVVGRTVFNAVRNWIKS
jgi:hypothetical protein